MAKLRTNRPKNAGSMNQKGIFKNSFFVFQVRMEALDRPFTISSTPREESYVFFFFTKDCVEILRSMLSSSEIWEGFKIAHFQGFGHLRWNYRERSKGHMYCTNASAARIICVRLEKKIGCSLKINKTFLSCNFWLWFCKKKVTISFINLSHRSWLYLCVVVML